MYHCMHVQSTVTCQTKEPGLAVGDPKYKWNKTETAEMEREKKETVI